MSSEIKDTEELIEKYKTDVNKENLQADINNWKSIQAIKGRPDTSKMGVEFELEIKDLLRRQNSSSKDKAQTCILVEKKPEKFKEIYLGLINEESSDLNNRLNIFFEKSGQLLKEIETEALKNDNKKTVKYIHSGADATTASIYLTNHNPEENIFFQPYIYDEFKILLKNLKKANPQNFEKFRVQLDRTDVDKKNRYAHFCELIKLFINVYIKPQSELIEIGKKYLPNEMYNGNNHLILAWNILYNKIDHPKSKQIASNKNNAEEQSGDEMESEKETQENIKYPINKILYGPPGTGKTYTLKKDYFPQYTIDSASISKEQHFALLANDCTWWEVFALALIEDGATDVNDIINNRWVKQKALTSMSKNVRATARGCLLAHTISTSETVGVKQRQFPYIFDMKNDSSWEVIEKEAREQAPELYELLEKAKNFSTNPEKKIENYVFITFHQSYSYEDFIEGIKPILNNDDGQIGYRIEDGIFKKLCQDAKNDPSNRFAIFIDEINRGNISNIFGELITLIEFDKRKGATNEMEVTLPYSKEKFSVPINVDIYGTMNTADRSVEALDTALRRRFSFEEMPSKPDLIKTNGALKDSNGVIEGIDLVEVLSTINKRLEQLVDKDHMIGHSYFLPVKELNDLKKVFQNNIIPLLQEYFFGDYGKMGLVLGEGFVTKNDNSSKKSFFAKFDDYDDAPLLEKPIYQLTFFSEDDNNKFIEAIFKLLR